MTAYTQLEKRILWFFPSAGVLVFVLLFWESLFFMPTMINGGDGDLGRHVTFGNVVLSTRAIPTRDLFSNTMLGAPFVPHEWLSETLFALAYDAAGLNGVAWFTALLIAVTFALVAVGLRALGVGSILAVAFAIAASVVGALHALPRPHLFSWLFCAIFVLVLEHYRRDGRVRRLLILPVLMVAWVNLHPGFIYGLGILGLYLAGAILERNWQSMRRLTVTLAAAWVASLVNPVGITMMTNSLALAQDRFIVDVTSEYQSPNFHILSTWPFIGMLVLSFFILGRADRPIKWTPILLLASWTGFALYAVRNIPIYAIVAAFILAPEAQPMAQVLLGKFRFLARMEELDRLAWGWMWAAAAVLVLVLVEAAGGRLDVRNLGNAFDPHVFPVAAVDRLQESPPAGNMFNEFTWGGYLIYRLWPAERVFIDGQTDLYGDALTREYVDILSGPPDWEQLLDRYNIGWVILPPTRPLSLRLNQSPDWVLWYKDSTAGVWVKR
ncbi:MAG: hypothetical protein M1482_00115 [Chloroflexi bacterium]|nr:hypothetical protein [Chloroflexota bacterium]